MVRWLKLILLVGMLYSGEVIVANEGKDLVVNGVVYRQLIEEDRFGVYAVELNGDAHADIGLGDKLVVIRCLPQDKDISPMTMDEVVNLIENKADVALVFVLQSAKSVNGRSIFVTIPVRVGEWSLRARTKQGKSP